MPQSSPESDTDDSSELDEEQYLDTVAVEATENCAIVGRSDLVRFDIDSYDHDDLVCGVTVSQDGSNIAIKAGTLNETEAPDLHTWNGLTPDAAREIADGLYEAADNAEQAMKGSEADESSTEDERSFIRRLISRST